MKPYKALCSQLKEFRGVRTVEIAKAEIDSESGGVLPAAISISFAQNSEGFRALEFIVWALGDMRQAGANVHHHLRSPPPWLNEPGASLSFVAYVNPRSRDIADSKAVSEISKEIGQMADFFAQVREQFWPRCCQTH